MYKIVHKGAGDIVANLMPYLQKIINYNLLERSKFPTKPFIQGVGHSWIDKVDTFEHYAVSKKLLAGGKEQPGLAYI